MVRLFKLALLGTTLSLLGLARSLRTHASLNHTLARCTAVSGDADSTTLDVVVPSRSWLSDDESEISSLNTSPDKIDNHASQYLHLFVHFT